MLRHGYQLFIDARNKVRQIYKKGRSNTKAVYIWLIYSIYFVIIAVDVENWKAGTFEQLIGVMLFVIGVLIGGWSLYVLNIHGSYHEEIVFLKDGCLVRKGPYRLIRHPMRVGLLMEMTGILIISGMYLFIPVVLLVGIILHKRTLEEEWFLLEVYGKRYQDYKINVGRYFPIFKLSRP